MDDYEILKYLGLEIRDESVIFYDDDSLEHILEFREIKDISLDNASIPVENKLGFWMEKLFVQRNSFSLFSSKTYNEDYRDIYELEIELTDHRVLSRKVRDANIFECNVFIKIKNDSVGMINTLGNSFKYIVPITFLLAIANEFIKINHGDYYITVLESIPTLIIILIFLRAQKVTR